MFSKLATDREKAIFAFCLKIIHMEPVLFEDLFLEN